MVGLCGFYPDICLTTEEVARKNPQSGSEKPQSEYSTHITKTPTHHKTHIYTHPHITKPTHAHTHTLQNPHIRTPTHYKTHTYIHPHITKPTHTHTHTLQSPHIHTPTHYKTSSNNHITRYISNEIVTIQSSTFSINKVTPMYMSLLSPRTSP